MRLGFRQGEADIYLACLKQPRGLFVNEIVKTTHLQRSTVDVMLERLCQRGWMSALRDGSRLRYCANNLDNSLANFEEALEVLKQELPRMASRPTGLTETKISFFEGVEGAKRCYQNILNYFKAVPEKDRFFVNFSSGKNIMKIWPKMTEEFIYPRIKAGIKIFTLSNPTEKNMPHWEPNEAELRYVRCFGDQYLLRINLIIYGPYIAIISTSPPISSVVIENPLIAMDLSQVFWILWDFLPDGQEASAAKKRKSKARKAMEKP